MRKKKKNLQKSRALERVNRRRRKVPIKKKIMNERSFPGGRKVSSEVCACDGDGKKGGKEELKIVEEKKKRDLASTTNRWSRERNSQTDELCN